MKQYNVKGLVVSELPEDSYDFGLELWTENYPVSKFPLKSFLNEKDNIQSLSILSLQTTEFN